MAATESDKYPFLNIAWVCANNKCKPIRAVAQQGSHDTCFLVNVAYEVKMVILLLRQLQHCPNVISKM